jgi:hypothetical protein
VKNCAPTELELARNDFIGTLENVTGCETQEINPAYLQAVRVLQEKSLPKQSLKQKDSSLNKLYTSMCPNNSENSTYK